MQRVTIQAEQWSKDIITLTDDQCHYLRRVLRLENGDRFIVLDGKGCGWIACLGDESRTAHILDSYINNTELSAHLSLLMAMPKKGMDEVVRQATELGVRHIFPILSDRVLLNPSPQKQKRWQRILQEATEQSERQQVPSFHSPNSLAQRLHSVPEGFRFICVARTPENGAPHLLTALSDGAPYAPGTSITLAIGPEGGWTQDEINQAIAAGYQPASLGPRILRAVTAPLAALSIVAAILEQ